MDKTFILTSEERELLSELLLDESERLIGTPQTDRLTSYDYNLVGSELIQKLSEVRIAKIRQVRKILDLYYKLEDRE